MLIKFHCAMCTEIHLGTVQNQITFQYNENLVKLILINISIGMRDI